jgi:hypothetical protein
MNMDIEMLRLNAEIVAAEAEEETFVKHMSNSKGSLLSVKVTSVSASYQQSQVPAALHLLRVLSLHQL